MVRNEKGFTLVELLIAMVVFTLAMIAATNSFMPLVNQFKQQGKITETQVEGVMGLDMIRMDIESAGFGLPRYIYDSDNDGNWSNDWVAINSSNGYAEAKDTASYNAYDDTGQAPRAIVVGNDVGTDASDLGENKSDYLVIKAANVREHEKAKKWTYMYMHPAAGLSWQPDGTAAMEWKDGSGAFDSERNFLSNTWTIAVKPSIYNEYYNVLMTGINAANVFSYYDEFDNFDQINNKIRPFDPAEVFVLYGIGDADANKDPGLRMPFNRADYFISSGNVPARCAMGTGVLEKGVISHKTGERESGLLPLLDCVADMQVIAGLDTNNDGAVDSYDESLLATGSAEDIRNQVKEVRIYILMHEGQRDNNFTYPNNTIEVGEFSLGKTGPKIFNFNDEGIVDWQNYRWKVHTMVVYPDNLI